MKRTAFDHPKVRKLARLLDVPHYCAIGILESLWHFTAKHAPRGNVGRWDDESIAGWIGWPVADVAKLLDALVQAGLVDRHATHRFVIHDWHDHADESVKKTIAKHKITFASLDEPGAIDPPRDPTDQPKIENGSGSFENGSGSFENGSGSFENVPEQSPTESACLSLSPCLSLSHSSSSPKLRFDDQDMELAKWMFERVRTINPNHKAPSFDDWANDIRLMRERDGADRTLAGIRELFTWANADSFWQSNILSPAKLRKQWDQLTAKRKTNGKQQHNAGSDSPARVRQRDWSNVESIRGGSANGPAQPATAAGL